MSVCERHVRAHVLGACPSDAEKNTGLNNSSSNNNPGPPVCQPLFGTQRQSLVQENDILKIEPLTPIAVFSSQLSSKSDLSLLSPLPPDGVAAFHAFLKTEFSEENLEFWLACEEFKKIRSATKLASRAHHIFDEYIRSEAPKEVSVPAPAVTPPDPVCLFPTENRGQRGKD